MDINYIKMHLVIERFVQGKLTDDEEAVFEERLVWDKDMQEQVELAETTRDWLLTSADQNKYAFSETGRLSGFIRSVAAAPRYAAAASFVLGILITFSVLKSPDSEMEFAMDESAPSLVMPLLVTRSSNSDLQPIPVKPGAVTTLLIDVPDPTQQFNVLVQNGTTGDSVWEQTGLVAGYLEAVAVGIPGGAVPPGEYVLSISSTVATGGFQQEIRFRTVTSN